MHGTEKYWEYRHQLESSNQPHPPKPGVLIGWLDQRRTLWVFVVCCVPLNVPGSYWGIMPLEHAETIVSGSMIYKYIMIYLDVLHFGRSRLGFLQSTYPCTGVTWDVTSLKVFNWVKEGSGYTVYRCIQYLHTTTLLLWCCRLIVWTCLDPAFPFFLCQSACATLCAHIHHKKKHVSLL